MNQRKAPELQDDEYLVVTIEKGVLTPWAFSREALAALSASSKAWDSSAVWKQFSGARELPRHVKWGDFGKGLVTIDLDNKKTYNLTDSFCLVHFNAPRYERVNKEGVGSYYSQKVINEFLDNNENKDHMVLSFSSPDHGFFRVKLSEFLKHLPQDEWHSALQVDEQGHLMYNWPELNMHSFSIIHPEWEHDSSYIRRGLRHQVCLNMLNDVSSLGVPWPSWKSLAVMGEERDRNLSHDILDEDMPIVIRQTWPQMIQVFKNNWKFPQDANMYRVEPLKERMNEPYLGHSMPPPFMKPPSLR